MLRKLSMEEVKGNSSRKNSDVSDILEILFGLVFLFLKNSLIMCWISAKIVPCLLREKHKANHVSMCQGLLRRLKRDPEFLSKIVTVDEVWVYKI
jgi:hypothetical protein